MNVGHESLEALHDPRHVCHSGVPRTGDDGQEQGQEHSFSRMWKPVLPVVIRVGV
jgi:hypothetical protein